LGAGPARVTKLSQTPNATMSKNLAVRLRVIRPVVKRETAQTNS
jgi:hypothetical protein